MPSEILPAGEAVTQVEFWRGMAKRFRAEGSKQLAARAEKYARYWLAREKRNAITGKCPIRFEAIQ